MGTEFQDLRDRLHDEGRIAGLGDDYSDRALRRRKAQIIFVAVALITGLVFVMLLDSFRVDENGPLSNVTVLRMLLILLASVMCAYVLDKERHLKRVEALRSEERAMNLALAESLLHSSVLAETERELTSVLDLGELVELSLDRMLDVVDSADGVLMLRSGDVELRAAAIRSESLAWPTRVKIQEPLIARDVSSGEIVIASAPTGNRIPDEGVGTDRVVGEPLPGGFDETAMVGNGVFIQLVCRGAWLGCVAVAPHHEEPFSAEERELLGEVAQSAAMAIANARRHEAALLQLDRTRSQLAELVELAS